MGLDRWEQAVLQRWKSLRFLERYIQRELSRINQACFGGQLSFPMILLDRMRYSKNWEGGFSGARYLPPNGHRVARIQLFPLLLLEKRDVQAALGHELVHHWEFERPGENFSGSCPGVLEEIITRRLGDPLKREQWLKTHSPRFLKKSCEVADFLGMPVKDFLFR